MNAREHRRLAAIVAADVAGYSRLMGEDDSGTLQTLKAHRRELIDPKISEYGGRIVKTTGDGLLLEFPSVVDATCCAVDVQRAMAERNAGSPVDRRIEFRMGVNVGDIIVDGDDIYGDGVNVAARLEALSAPGGVCISSKAYEHVRNKLDAAFEDRGLQQVKNIAQPIHVYALEPKRSSEGASVPASMQLGGPASSEAPALFGRDEDRAALSELVRGSPLVTVVGPGGVGKTRLAEAVAHDVRTAFTDGVRWVDLAPLGDPELVAHTLARALGLPVSDPVTALDVTVQALAGQHVLVVLDNCEHVLDAVDRVVAALRRGAPRVHVLATSQESLRHPDERIYRLATLALPAEATLASAQAAGAVQLFAARAQAVDRRFALTEQNVATVVDVCSRLDGIALAIELAAARVPLLGVTGLRQRLDERFRLLTAGSRLALRKHQTLHAALEWSYGLLSESEQKVFDRLGVFAGSFSMESAQKLASDAAIDEWVVLENLGALVDKSLVIFEDRKSARYRMLETTRAFALERLAMRNETSQMLRRHAEVLRDLFEGFYRQLLDGKAAEELAEDFAPDLDNLRGALRWASAPEGNRRIAVQLIGTAGTSRGFFRCLQLKAEGRSWCQSLRPLVDETIPADDAARFWLACADLGTSASLDQSVEDARQAIVLFGQAGDRRGEYLAWSALLFSLTLSGRIDEGVAAFEGARARCEPAWPPILKSILENIAGLFFQEQGDSRKAREHFMELLELSRQSGSAIAESTALALLIDLDVGQGEVERAAEAAKDLLRRYRARPDLFIGFDSGLQLRNIATALVAADALDEAEPVYREALAATRRNYGSGAFVLDDLTTLVARRGRLDDAARLAAYSELMYGRAGRRPRLVARRKRERLQALLAAKRSPEMLAKLYDEGRRLTEDQACALAFATPSTSDKTL